MRYYNKRKRWHPPKRRRRRRWKITKKRPYKPIRKNTQKLFRKKNPIKKYFWTACICALIIIIGFLVGRLSKEIREKRDTSSAVTAMIDISGNNYIIH